MEARGHRMLILRPELGLGGVEARFVAIAEQLQARGGRATVLAGPGPLTERMAACADLRVVDFAGLDDSELRALVCGAAGGHSSALLAFEPLLLRAVPALAERVPVLLGLYGRGDRNRGGFGLAGGRRVPEAVRALVDSGRVAPFAVAAEQARSHARQLGLPEEAIAVSPNGIPIPDKPPSIAHGPVRSLVLVSRLAPDKRFNLLAAIELAAAGRAAGRDVTLHVYGGGPAAALARRMLARRLPAGAWRMHGPTAAPSEAFAGADAVVGTGLASAEALVLGRRVVPAKTVADPRGRLGPPVTPDTFDDAAAENFGWRTRPPVPAEQVWAELEAMDDARVAAVCERARTELSAGAMLDRELALLDTLGRRPSASALSAAERLLGSRFAGARRLPRPLDLPDRAVLQLRDQGKPSW